MSWSHVLSNLLKTNIRGNLGYKELNLVFLFSRILKSFGLWFADIACVLSHVMKKLLIYFM